MNTQQRFMLGVAAGAAAGFAISDALPGLTVSAERAARQIIDACRYGDPQLTISLPAQIATVISVLTPGVLARTLGLAARLLPGPAGPQGDEPRSGRESTSRWAPSIATGLSDRAAVLNNEVAR